MNEHRYLHGGNHATEAAMFFRQEKSGNQVDLQVVEATLAGGDLCRAPRADRVRSRAIRLQGGEVHAELCTALADIWGL